MAVVSSMLVSAPIAVTMFLTMMEQHSSHVLDSGALDIVPDDARQALLPDPVDGGARSRE